MKDWERTDKEIGEHAIPESIAHTYPQTLDEAVKYYTAGGSRIADSEKVQNDKTHDTRGTKLIGRRDLIS